MKTEQMKLDGMTGLVDDTYYDTRQEFIASLLLNRFMRPIAKRTYKVKKAVEIFQSETLLSIRARKDDVLTVNEELIVKKKIQ